MKKEFKDLSVDEQKELLFLKKQLNFDFYLYFIALAIFSVPFMFDSFGVYLFKFQGIVFVMLIIIDFIFYFFERRKLYSLYGV